MLIKRSVYDLLGRHVGFINPRGVCNHISPSNQVKHRVTWS
jgi:hypothetical protein